MPDIVVTWPKSRPLGSYIAELELARRDKLVVCFRVPTLPRGEVERCYRVHDGRVRGWLRVIECSWKREGEVGRVASDPRPGAYWPEGFYVVCDPLWHDWAGPIMNGFQGWRWFARA